MKFQQKIPRNLRGSGYKEVKNDSVIAQNQIFTFALDERFKPYADVLVVNLNTSSDCEVLVNWGKTLPLFKGNSAKIDTPVENLAVKNINAGSISANEIKVYYRALPQIDDKIQKGINIMGAFSTLKGLVR